MTARKACVNRRKAAKSSTHRDFDAVRVREVGAGARNSLQTGARRV
jgi:hypothetical protein